MPRSWTHLLLLLPLGLLPNALWAQAGGPCPPYCVAAPPTAPVAPVVSEPVAPLIDPCRANPQSCRKDLVLPDTSREGSFRSQQAPLTVDAKLSGEVAWMEEVAPAPRTVPEIRYRLRESRALADRGQRQYLQALQEGRGRPKNSPSGYPNLPTGVLLEVEQADAGMEAQRLRLVAEKTRGDAFEALLEAKTLRSPGARAVAEVRAEAKQAESRALAARGDALEAEGSSQGPHLKSVAAARQEEAAQQKARLENSERNRAPERQAEMARAFSSVVAGAGRQEALRETLALRHELKKEALRPALKTLAADSKAADLPPCVGRLGECMPQPGMFRTRGGQRELRAVQGVKRLQSLEVGPGVLETPGSVRQGGILVPSLAFLPQIQQKRALLLGINHYQDKEIPSLESAVRDVELVAKDLKEKLGYQVKVVRDASRADIVTEMARMAGELGPEDSVAIYYAGHGYLDEDTGKGYWIPADGRADHPGKWVSNEDIARLLTLLPTKQVILVSDSCYSGSLAKEQKLSGAEVAKSPKEVLARRTVTVMSSGGEEPVSDEGKEGQSIFAWNLRQALGAINQVEPGGGLYARVRAGVTAEFPQTPQYGAALSAGHQPGGDYLFERRVYK